MDVVLPKSGKYLVAVSGGVDSVSLLHLLKDTPGVELVVAHFDHGIRSDSGNDRKFVEQLAKEYGLPFAYTQGRLGSGVSEATARAARYDFLRQAQHENSARAIITAHHQDDVLETVIINLLRGTGRKGLSSLVSREGIERPLLQVPKNEILGYARQNNLQWREDSTNADESYLRNYIRQQIVPRFNEKSRAELLNIIETSAETNSEIDTLLVKYLHTQTDNDSLDRQWFNDLSHAIAREVMAAWLRSHSIRDFDSKTLERLVVAGKTGRSGNRFDVSQAVTMQINKHDLALLGTER